MSDVITGLRQVIQDLVAPELKSHAIKLDGLQRQLETLQISTEMQYESVSKTLDAFRAEIRSEFLLLKTNN